jgi:hypothetical protein
LKLVAVDAGGAYGQLPSWFLQVQRCRKVYELKTSSTRSRTNTAKLISVEIWWLGALQHQVSSRHRDAETLTPWGLLAQMQAPVNDEELTSTTTWANSSRCCMRCRRWRRFRLRQRLVATGKGKSRKLANDSLKYSTD